MVARAARAKVPGRRGKVRRKAVKSREGRRKDPQEGAGVPGGLGLPGGRSERGPPVATKSGWLSCRVANDEWQTTLESWRSVAPYFHGYRRKSVWMPFYYDGACAGHLRSLGFEKVIHEQEDFFQRVKDKSFLNRVDLIWDNPPYTAPEMKAWLFGMLSP
ncbi:unnamed protein product [Symbiodinium natans]|uniref:Uncharacterized protein n=1 Tax=Symbiodinium natans TaxID=878477 RepID=A0A812NAK3_9DINO|nr:unnamed protein product [Symbiodinium natans]